MGRTLFSRDGLGVAALILQHSDILVRDVRFELPVLTFVLRGAKTLRWNKGEATVGAGQAFAIAAGMSFDVLNTPDRQRMYEARWIAFSAEILETFSAPDSGAAPIRDTLPLADPGAEFQASFFRAFEAARDAQSLPQAVAVARWKEVLTWIALCGGRFEPRSFLKVKERTRFLLSSRPGLPWTSSDLALQIGMSEATLRRKLAAEGESFSTLLTDVRMSQALNLLQASDRTVEDIAQEVGYASASRFAVRFRARFGYSPREIRGKRTPSDRVGTIFDRA